MGHASGSAPRRGTAAPTPAAASRPWDLPQPGGCCGGEDGGEEPPPVRADLLGGGGARGRRVWQAVRREALDIALEPRGGDPGPEPARSGGGERVQRVAERLAHELRPVEHLDGREDVGRVGALAAARLDQPLVAQHTEERVVEPRLRLPRQQPRAELAQDRGVEAQVVEGQAQGVLPVDAPADR